VPSGGESPEADGLNPLSHTMEGASSHCDPRPTSKPGLDDISDIPFKWKMATTVVGNLYPIHPLQRGGEEEERKRRKGRGGGGGGGEGEQKDVVISRMRATKSTSHLTFTAVDIATRKLTHSDGVVVRTLKPQHDPCVTILPCFGHPELPVIPHPSDEVP